MKNDQLWNEILALLREELGSPVIETWFKALTLTQWNIHTGSVTICAPNQFICTWITNHYYTALRNAIQRTMRSAHELCITITYSSPSEPSLVTHAETPSQTSTPLPSLHAALQRTRTRSREQTQKEHALRVVPAARTTLERTSLQKIRRRQPTTLQEAYRFDTFIVGSHNSLAYAAAQAVSEKLGILYNPFFVYGDSGLGKTHLLHAIGNAVHAHNPSAHIVYQSAHRFVSDFINAIRFDKVYQFEAQFQNIDLLLLDDVQFLSNKEQTQELFFHLFNTLHQAKKQIVCTSDSLPRDIAGLAARIRSRLESGLVTDISTPTLETKIAILKKKAEGHGVAIPNDVAEYLSSLKAHNIRDLEGILVRLCAAASLSHEPISLELAQRLFGATHTEHRPILEKIGLPQIARTVSRHFEYSLDELRSQKRDRDLSFARHIALYLMKKHTTSSLKEVGSYLHRTDHSTVIHAIEKVERLAQSSQTCRDIIQTIEKNLSIERAP